MFRQIALRPQCAVFLDNAVFPWRLGGAGGILPYYERNLRMLRLTFLPLPLGE